jgi:hypothetical protein
MPSARSTWLGTGVNVFLSSVYRSPAVSFIFSENFQYISPNAALDRTEYGFLLRK